MKSAIFSHLLILLASCMTARAANSSSSNSSTSTTNSSSSDTALYTYALGADNKTFELAMALNTTSNDIYFNMTAPSEYSWFSFGIGKGMAGALYFIGYPSANGTAITFSPRLAGGNVQPYYTPAKQVETLSSKVTPNNYELLAVCRNCSEWSGGSLDTKSTAQEFMFALGPTGDPIASDSTSQNIKIHVLHKNFQVNMLTASFTGSSVPSLVGSSAPTNSAPMMGGGGGPPQIYNRVHGIFGAIAFVIIFPLGVIFLRIVNNVILHGITQALGYAFIIVVLGTGIVLSQGNYNSAHQIIGLILFSLLAIQALGGLVHHLIYKRTKKPTIIGKVHIVLGISLMILGIVNVPLGLNLAGDSKWNRDYIIIVAVLGAAFLALRFWKIWDNTKKARAAKDQDGSEKGITQTSSN